MKNKTMKTIGTSAMTILMLAIFANIPTYAQDVSGEPQTENVFNQSFENSGDLEGTWDVQVTIRNCQNNAAIRTFPSITTFMSGGTMLDSTSGIPQALKTPGHGVWQHLTGNRYRFKFKSFSFDAGGNPTGWSIITHEADLKFLFVFPINRRVNSYDSAGNVRVFDMNGNLTFTGCSSTTAVRFE